MPVYTASGHLCPSGYWMCSLSLDCISGRPISVHLNICLSSWQLLSGAVVYQDAPCGPASASSARVFCRDYITLSFCIYLERTVRIVSPRISHRVQFFTCLASLDLPGVFSPAQHSRSKKHASYFTIAIITSPERAVRSNESSRLPTNFLQF